MTSHIEVFVESGGANVTIEANALGLLELQEAINRLIESNCDATDVEILERVGRPFTITIQRVGN